MLSQSLNGILLSLMSAQTTLFIELSPSISAAIFYCLTVKVLPDVYSPIGGFRTANTPEIGHWSCTYAMPAWSLNGLWEPIRWSSSPLGNNCWSRRCGCISSFLFQNGRFSSILRGFCVVGSVRWTDRFPLESLTLRRLSSAEREIEFNNFKSAIGGLLWYILFMCFQYFRAVSEVGALAFAIDIRSKIWARFIVQGSFWTYT
jgi:hypothetical protein